MKKEYKDQLAKIKKVVEEEILPALHNAVDDIQEVFDNMEGEFNEKSEDWQESDRGQTFSEEMEAIEALRDDLDNAASEVESVTDEM